MNALLLLASTDGEWGHAWFPLWLLFWAAVVGIGVWLVLRPRGPRDGGPHDRAREILAERYARGELTADEYRQRLDDLQLARGAGKGG